MPWDQIVKGYEYEKEKFVVLKEEDFKRVDVEATQTIEIIDFGSRIPDPVNVLTTPGPADSESIPWTLLPRA